MSTEPIWARPEPGARRAGLSRDEIAAAAVRIADKEGFEAVSMRRVAAELGAGTMSLYHYVANKKELVALMDNALMGELLVPGELPSDWRAALTTIAERTREVFVRHPWALEAMKGSEEGGPNGTRHFEQSLQAVAGTGLDWRGRLELVYLVDEYVFGFAMREAYTEAEGLTDVESALAWAPDSVVEYFGELIATGEFPELAKLPGEGDTRETLRQIVSVMMDQGRFRRGLDRLLDGVEASLP